MKLLVMGVCHLFEDVSPASGPNLSVGKLKPSPYRSSYGYESSTVASLQDR